MGSDLADGQAEKGMTGRTTRPLGRRLLIPGLLPLGLRCIDLIWGIPDPGQEAWSRGDDERGLNAAEVDLLP